MREAGGIGEVAEGRKTVLALFGKGRCRKQSKSESGSAGNRPPDRGARHQSCDELGSRAASVWSNHQT